MAVQAQPQFPFYGSQDSIDNVNSCGAGINQFCSSYSHQQCNSLFFDSSSPPNTSNQSSLPHLHSISAYEDNQRQDVDHYIRLQNERLRLLVQEQRKQHVALLLKKIESETMPLLRKKDEEIARAVKRTMELQDFLGRLEVENQAWQRAAQEKEAMVVLLNNTIEQMREKAAATCCFDNGAEDAESRCDVIMRSEDETEQLQQRNRLDDNNFNVTQERKNKKMMICKGCNSRDSCILFLPCRHLCSCEACEAFLDSCPVCLTGKKASIEALII